MGHGKAARLQTVSGCVDHADVSNAPLPSSAVVAVRRGSRGRLLGTANPVFIAFSALTIVAAFVFAWGWMTAAPNGPDNVLSAGLPLSLIVANALMSATTRIVGDPDGYLRVVGYWLTWSVPPSQIAEVVIDDGLKVVTVTGRRVGTAAYGYSATAAVLK